MVHQCSQFVTSRLTSRRLRRKYMGFNRVDNGELKNFINPRNSLHVDSLHLGLTAMDLELMLNFPCTSHSPRPLNRCKGSEKTYFDHCSGGCLFLPRPKTRKTVYPNSGRRYRCPDRLLFCCRPPPGCASLL